jgi:hypothetical protein
MFRGFSTRYLDCGCANAEDVTMLRECHGELCAVLGVSGVAGRGSMVPDSPSSSSVSGLCRPSLVLLVLVLVLVLGACTLDLLLGFISALVPPTTLVPPLGALLR